MLLNTCDQIYEWIGDVKYATQFWWSEINELMMWKSSSGNRNGDQIWPVSH